MSYGPGHGFTRIELIIIVVILAVLLSILIPAILATRENSRKHTCSKNLMQIGIGMHTYYDSFKRFPNSAGVVGTGPMKAGDSSFLFKISYFVGGYEQKISAISPNWKDFIDPDRKKYTTLDPLTNPDPAIVKLRNLQIPLFLCPSNSNKVYEDPAKKLIAFTNYKAMGATCMESLKLCVDPDSPPPYGDKKNHPDGALFPGNTGIQMSDIPDGISNTIMVVETIDDLKSSWIAGSDVTLVGMPKADSYTKFQGYSFFAPLDYNGGEYQDATPAIRAMQTYTAFDFQPGKKEAGTYPAGVGRTPAYGPSSSHAGIVNHLFGDLRVMSIRKDVDYTLYFFWITKNNDEPTPQDSLDLKDSQ